MFKNRRRYSIILKRIFNVIVLFFFMHNLGALDLNEIEKYFLEKSQKKISYDGEYFPVIETENLSELGKFTALSFLKFVENNPKAVISLPTGKTPEYFIKYLKYYKTNWQKKDVQEELNLFGFNSINFPDTTNLKLVQIDEFFPIDPDQENSFTHFIKKYYLPLLDLKKENVLLMEDIFVPTLKKESIAKIFKNRRVNLSVLNKKKKNKTDELQVKALKELQYFCKVYEKKINELGGIDFF